MTRVPGVLSGWRDPARPPRDEDVVPDESPPGVDRAKWDRGRQVAFVHMLDLEE